MKQLFRQRFLLMSILMLGLSQVTLAQKLSVKGRVVSQENLMESGGNCGRGGHQQRDGQPTRAGITSLPNVSPTGFADHLPLSGYKEQSEAVRWPQPG